MHAATPNCPIENELAADVIRQIVSDTCADVQEIAMLDGGIVSQEGLRRLKHRGDRCADDLIRLLGSNDNLLSIDTVVAQYDERRRGGYWRLIVEQFAQLFAIQPSSGSALMSRRMLPGIFMAIDVILGPKQRSLYDVRAREIEGPYEPGLETGLSAANKLAMDLLVQVAESFSPYESRARWFINMVNGHVAPVSQTSLSAVDEHNPVQGEIRPMTNIDLKIFLRTLFVDLRFNIESAPRRAILEVRHDAKTIATVRDVLREVWTPLPKQPNNQDHVA